MAAKVSFTGYHGTEFDNVESILADGLYKAKLNDRWLGPGIYFFVKGIGNPIEHARNWITTNAIDNYSRMGVINKQLQFAVLQANIIEVKDQLVDFRTPDGADLFCYVVDALFEKLKSDGGMNLKKGHIDGFVCRWLNEHSNINIFIADRFIKLTTMRRFDYADYTQRQANCTICAVYNPDLITKLEVIKKGQML